MQGHRKRGRTWVIVASGVVTIMLVAMIGVSGNIASAATDTPPCLTPTPLPTGTITATSSPSPTALPPTATVAQMNGRLLGDAPATATGTTNPTPLPTCTPTPAPMKASLTATPVVPATAHTSAAPVTSVGAASAATGAPQAVAVLPATGVPAATPARVSVQAAPSSASIAPPASAASASTSSSSSSSSSAPPAAAVGLPPPPPPGYVASVGNTPDSVGGTPVVSVVRGNIAPAGAPSVPFPGPPSAARPAVSSGYAAGPTGVAAPIVTPRTGHSRSGSGVPLAFLIGIACLVVGVSLRGISWRRGIRV